VVTESLRENFGEAELAKLNEIVAVTEILEVTKGSPLQKRKVRELLGTWVSCTSLSCLPPFEGNWLLSMLVSVNTNKILRQLVFTWQFYCNRKI
jgi:hypothetical protein